MKGNKFQHNVMIHTSLQPGTDIEQVLYTDPAPSACHYIAATLLLPIRWNLAFHTR
jgi:hypothetical protein